MKRLLWIACIICCPMALYASPSSDAAIEYAKTLTTNSAQITYLVNEGNKLYQSDEFQSAIDIAQHVLRYLDKDSDAAKDLIKKAESALKKAAADKLEQSFGGKPW